MLLTRELGGRRAAQMLTCAAVALAIAPYLAWQASHGWPELKVGNPGHARQPPLPVGRGLAGTAGRSGVLVCLTWGERAGRTGAGFDDGAVNTARSFVGRRSPHLPPADH
jgi:hypothetical protein